MRVDRDAILSQLSAGHDFRAVADEHGLHPFLVAHILREHQKIKTILHASGRRPEPVRSVASHGGEKVATNRRRTRLDPDTLRAQVARGMTAKEIAAEHPGLVVASIYKALKRWDISFTPSNQNGKRGHAPAPVPLVAQALPEKPKPPGWSWRNEMRRCQQKISPEDLRLAVEQGKTAKEIALENDYKSPCSVISACHSWGIPLPRIAKLERKQKPQR